MSAESDKAASHPELPLTIAHRAGNDLAKLDAAFSAGIEYAEADVWWRRSRLEVRHDKTAGPLPFLWDRWSLRSDRSAILLSDVLSAALGRGKVFLDLKGSATGLADGIAFEATRLNAAEMIAASGNWPHLDALSALLPGVPVFYSVGSLRRLESLRPRVEKGSVPGVSIDVNILTHDIVRELRQSGVQTIVTWHVETAETARQVLSWGIGGITSSNTELLATIRRGELR